MEYGTVIYRISPIALGLTPYILSALLKRIIFATVSSKYILSGFLTRLKLTNCTKFFCPPLTAVCGAR